MGFWFIVVNVKIRGVIYVRVWCVVVIFVGFVLGCVGLIFIDIYVRFFVFGIFGYICVVKGVWCVGVSGFCVIVVCFGFVFVVVNISYFIV